MKVKAIAMGQYKNRLIERGHVFEIESDKEFSSRWMAKVPSDNTERRQPENKDDRKYIDEQLLVEKMEDKR